MKFKCSCGSTQIEEVMNNVIQYSNVDDVEVTEDGSVCLDYGPNSCEGGDVVVYQCAKCGEKIATNEDDLLDFLKKNDML